MTRWLGPLLVLLCSAISIGWGYSIGGNGDFKAVYYGSRTLIQHHNPYATSEVEGVIGPGSGEHDSRPGAFLLHQCLTLYVNLPPTLLIVAPLAMLPFGIAHGVWMIATGGVFTLAGVLIWEIGSKHAPILSTCLIGLLLANCEILFMTGNTAGIVVSLCVIAVWCFLRERFVLVGILCMAVSLAIKPHNAGLVWLFFFLGGAVYRKRALQTLVVTAVLAFPSVLWVSHVAPHWIHDWRSNMITISAPGSLNDPRPASVKGSTADGVISLQAVFSIFSDDPRIYNSASYLVCGALLLIWTITTLRSHPSKDTAWLALAAVVPLTILITYHRVYDSKLLLLTVPACALLWAKGGKFGWIAVGLTAVGVLLNGDIPLVILGGLTEKLHLSIATLPGQILTVVLARPSQEILLAMSLFYLWVYVRGPIPILRASGEVTRGTIPAGGLASVSQETAD
jgi:hypothetical protein